MSLKKAFSLMEIIVSILIIGVVAGFLSQALTSNLLLNKRMSDYFLAKTLFYEIESDVRLKGISFLNANSNDAELIIDSLINNNAMITLSTEDSLQNKINYFKNNVLIESQENLSLQETSNFDASQLASGSWYQKLIRLHPALTNKARLMEKFPNKNYQVQFQATLNIDNANAAIAQNSHYLVSLALIDNEDSQNLGTHSFKVYPYPNEERYQHQTQTISNQCLLYRLQNQNAFPTNISTLNSSNFQPTLNFLHPYSMYSFTELSPFFVNGSFTDKVFNDWQFATPNGSNTVYRSCKLISKTRTHYFDAGYHSYALPSLSKFIRINTWGAAGLENAGSFSSQIFKIKNSQNALNIVVGQSLSSSLNSGDFWQDCNGYGCPNADQAGSSAVYDHTPSSSNHAPLHYATGGKHSFNTSSNPFDSNQLNASTQNTLEACANTLVQVSPVFANSPEFIAGITYIQNAINLSDYIDIDPNQNLINLKNAVNSLSSDSLSAEAVFGFNYFKDLVNAASNFEAINTLFNQSFSGQATYTYTPLIQQIEYNYDTYRYVNTHRWVRDEAFDNLRNQGWTTEYEYSYNPWGGGVYDGWGKINNFYPIGESGEYYYWIENWLYGSWNGWTGYIRWWAREYKVYSNVLTLQEQIRNVADPPPVADEDWLDGTQYIYLENTYITVEGTPVTGATSLPPDPNSYTNVSSQFIHNTTSITLNNFTANSQVKSASDSNLSDNAGYVIIETLFELDQCPVENNVYVPAFNQVYQINGPKTLPQAIPFTVNHSP